MSDQSFSKRELERALIKGDFHHIPQAERTLYKSEVINSAYSTAANLFANSTPLRSFKLRNKIVFQLPELSDELVVRKACRNLKQTQKVKNFGRAEIIENLRLLLSEGVPYCIYRLDVSSFYESFNKQCILSNLDNDLILPYQTKLIIKEILINHADLGGIGVPRGLALGAILSDRLMAVFDNELRTDSRIFFYARYVDDIILITDASEKTEKFIDEISNKLPDGLKLNERKKSVIQIKEKVQPRKTPNTPEIRLGDFDYLGYAFKILEPIKTKKIDYREVKVDIANAKIKKIKSRIIRTFIDFEKNCDWQLLLDRIKFMTNNFSIYDPKLGRRKLAGIFHSYPSVSTDAEGLKELDRFFRNAVLSKSGSLFSKTTLKLNGEKKRMLLAQSFQRGHTKQSFVHFSSQRIKQIQECWKY